MADEEKNTPDVAEFEAKLSAQPGNKDLWLFLIIVDVIFLCVFGFFLYKNLSARLLSPAEKQVPVVSDVEETSVPIAEEVTVTEKTVTVAPPATPAQPAASAEAKPQPVAQEQQTVEQPAPAKPAEKKESVIVKTNPKSKYRQVTFRYFGKADSVSVVSGFTMSKPRALKKKGDYWEITLGIAPGTYKFLYIVDGKQTTDPYSEEQDGRSVLTVK